MEDQNEVIIGNKDAARSYVNQITDSELRSLRLPAHDSPFLLKFWRRIPKYPEITFA